MGGKTISTSDTKIEALQLQSSAYGVTVPLCYGMPQIPGNLAWYGGFKATPHTTSQSAGGKGGGTKTQNTTFSYSASVMMGLCHGVINGIPRVWRGKEQFYGGVTPAQLITAAETFTAAVPGSSTVAHAAAWRAMVSVISDATGQGDNLVTGTYLAEGVHYTVAAGVYTWLAPAAGMGVTITYQYATGTVTQSALAQLGLSFIKGEIGQAAWSPLSTLAPTQAIGYSGMALVAGQDYSLGTGAQVDNHLFEIQAAMAYSVSSSTPDADPADIVGDVLLNARYGAGLPVERLGNTSLWANYNRASGLLCSPGITTQVRAADLVTMAARLSNTGVFWSAGRLKFVPYGDTALTGNGRTYTPNVTPLYDVTDDHYLDDAMPVDVQSKPPADRFNHIRLEFRHRGTFDATKQVFSGQYEIEIAEAKDQADIEANGLRSAPIEQMHWICDESVAYAVAYLLLYRSLFVTNSYVFRLPWTFALVEPMDLLTITDSAQGLDKLPVRVTARQEGVDNTLTFTAEDFPLGIATATQYANPLGLGFAHDFNAPPGPISAPVIFEAPGALVPTTGLEVYVAAVGTGANWGGCRVWVSLDGTTYKEAGRLLGGSRYGALAGAISGGVLPVTLLAGQLLSGSATDAVQLTTLCYIAGASPEFLAYQTATLTGTLAYSLSGLVPGAYGTPAAAHSSGDKFVRVDDAVAKSGALDLSYIGRTVHVKCTSFNVYGGAEEDLASVTDYTYLVTGAQIGSQPGYQQAELRLVNRNGMTIAGNTVTKTGGTSNAWDSSVISADGFIGGAFVSFRPAQTSADVMLGLNSDPITDNSYASIDYAWYPLSGGTLWIYENGSSAATGMSYVATDVLAIVYDGVTVKYLQNGIVRRSVAAPAGATYYLDSSFYTSGASASNLRFGPLSAVTGIDTAQLASNAATEIYLVNPAAVTITTQKHTPDGYTWNTLIAQITFTPTVTGRAQVFFDGRGTYTAPSTSGEAYWSIQDATGAYDNTKRIDGPLMPVGGAVTLPVTQTRSFAVTAGVAQDLRFYATKLNSGDTFVIDNMEMRVEMVKR